MDLARALDDLQNAGVRVYVAATGAGASVAERLWFLPGCSSFLVGASFPYAMEAIDEFLGFSPERYTSEETAIDLATSAFLHAGAGPTAVGLGLTASVASVAAHRGDHRVHVAWLSATSAGAHDVVLVKGTGAAKRREDGETAELVAFNALMDAVGRPRVGQAAGVLSYAVSNREALARERFFARPRFRADGTRTPAPAALAAALPGTFNPPHEGHFGMADAFREATGGAPTFWITAEPPHKEPVPLAELLRRARLLRGRDVLFTRDAPLYLDKARAYPGCTFLIGADAFVRMLDPKWGPSVDDLVAEFRALGTRFVVASRVVDGALVTLDDVSNAPRDLCAPLPGRWDVSSTELRNRG